MTSVVRGEEPTALSLGGSQRYENPAETGRTENNGGDYPAVVALGDGGHDGLKKESQRGGDDDDDDDATSATEIEDCAALAFPKEADGDAGGVPLPLDDSPKDKKEEEEKEKADADNVELGTATSAENEEENTNGNGNTPETAEEAAEEPTGTEEDGQPASDVLRALSSLLGGGANPAGAKKEESLAPTAIRFLDEVGMVHRKRNDLPDGRTVFSFGTQLENCNLDNRLDVREPRKLVALYSISPLRVPENKRQSAMEFFTRANYDLLNGCFEMDMRDGEFRYKVCSNFVGAEISHETIRFMYLVAANTMSRYFGGIMKVIYTGMDPAEAVRECEASVATPSSPQQ